ncbi:hypothetical protein DO97_02300 [Neosynechococcus sphagnicola sy1]|uniref:Uncharacterized protein n=1 Tax=Neosynechococcus sphagnicola sy1 TaxID=1497020 RepID=A0A098TLI0_9CYAN|nr:hypothetical protein [Neosynechococcus sphagnicola]KGF73164.1 hypothetical protein DO97_02300 [Neosynechococcus sphagnicola sy1]
MWQLILPTLAIGVALPSLAQVNPADTPLVPSSSTNLLAEAQSRSRAKNVARQTAEKINGGLEKYRADASVFVPGAAAIDQGDHWIFNILGGPPGATTPSIESEIRIDKADFTVTVLYNGPLRNQITP